MLIGTGHEENEEFIIIMQRGETFQKLAVRSY